MRVLWGEINRWARDCKVPLTSDKGGPLLLQHQNIRWINIDGPNKGELCPTSYMISLVSNPASSAAFQGHHVANVGDGIPRTLLISDESSSVPDTYYTMGSTWFHRFLAIGNPWPCTNFFRRGVKEGDAINPDWVKYVEATTPKV